MVNRKPIFVLTPRLGMARIATGNGARDGSGAGIADLLTGATDGTRIHQITVKATGTTTAGMIRLFVFDGTNVRLWKEHVVAAITPGPSTETFSKDDFRADNLPLLVLPLNHVLRVATHNTEQFDVMAHGGDFS